MNVDIAKRLADRRRAAGLTQEGLAEKLNVTRQAVSKWERSESSPDTDNLIALAELYGVSLDDLLYQDVPDGEDAADGSPRTEAEQTVDGANDSPAAAEPAGDAPESDDPASDGSQTQAGYSFESNDGTVHIGPEGIHVEDGKDHVHINWRDGVNVIDGKKGDKVHVGWDGIRVNDASFDNLQDANEVLHAHGHAHGHVWTRGHSKSAFGRAWVRFPFPLVAIIAYILLGALCDAWGMGLFLVFTIPLYYLVGALIDSKRLGPFLAGAYPLAAVAWFCWMAFVLNRPHPAWVVFLTIPLFEWLVVSISSWYQRRKRARG